ncbi:hypothetical protein NUM_68480 [Actinocatenispora comari]|uniref:Uncharacterized protein n=1 Tax=Actinocatenispora comari TaxID=2807577 RepID=A0A8J4AIX5_9ACTN|nr:hypothetical protein [Actinocatenispora comari]GIL31594.1 hypothetical protein NUM_68480 [Actinocatenispora comari]
MVRDGYYARWRDQEFDASPDGDRVRLYTKEPTAGFEQIGAQRYLRVVPRGDVSELGYLTVRCRWRDQPFQIIGEHGSWYRVEYLGELPPPDGLDLGEFDRGVHQAWAKRDEVSELSEQRT